VCVNNKRPPGAGPFHPRDWVELTPAFRRIMSFVAETGARARALTLVYINRDLSEEQLHAALVAPDNTIIKMLKGSDWQGRAVCSALNPLEGVWVEPPFEEGRVCIWRAGLDERYSTHLVTATPPAERQLPAAGESEPSQSSQAKRQPQQPSPATQPKRKPKRKLKRKPRHKAGPGRERIYNHEAITGAGNSVLARGRPDTKALFFEKVIAECRAAKPRIKLPSNIDVDDSLLRRVVGKLYDDML